MKTIYISIGNSDDKLSQKEWSEFVKDLDDICSIFERHGAWSSQSWSPYQNACICVEVPNNAVRELRNSLRGLAVRHRQDSIAMAIAETELVTP